MSNHTAATEARYYVYDRKVSDLTKFSAVNPRYWVMDRTTGKAVDEFSSATAARLTARDMNEEEAGA
jgi:hypothetical protein